MWGLRKWGRPPTPAGNRKQCLLPATCLVVSLLCVFLDLRMLTTECSPCSRLEGYGQNLGDRVADLGAELPSQRAACCVSFPRESLSLSSQRGLSTLGTASSNQRSPSLPRVPTTLLSWMRLGFWQQKAGPQTASAARENLLKFKMGRSSAQAAPGCYGGEPIFTVLGRRVKILLLWGLSLSRKRKPSWRPRARSCCLLSGTKADVPSPRGTGKRFPHT